MNFSNLYYIRNKQISPNVNSLTHKHTLTPYFSELSSGPRRPMRWGDWLGSLPLFKYTPTAVAKIGNNLPWKKGKDPHRIPRQTAKNKNGKNPIKSHSIFRRQKRKKEYAKERIHDLRRQDMYQRTKINSIPPRNVAPPAKKNINITPTLAKQNKKKNR